MIVVKKELSEVIVAHLRFLIILGQLPHYADKELLFLAKTYEATAHGYTMGDKASKKLCLDSGFTSELINTYRHKLTKDGSLIEVGRDFASPHRIPLVKLGPKIEQFFETYTLKPVFTYEFQLATV